MERLATVDFVAAEIEHTDRTHVLDPVYWSPSGHPIYCPTKLIEIDGEGRRFDQMYAYTCRRWQALCHGDTGKAAKASAVYLEPDANGQFDGSAIGPGDILWWGYIARYKSGKVQDSEEGAGVVVYVDSTSILVTSCKTIAAAAAQGKRRREALERNARLQLEREQYLRIWEAEQDRRTRMIAVDEHTMRAIDEEDEVALTLLD